MKYVPLFIETHYDMRGSTIELNELIQQAISFGYRSLAITDTKLYGAVQFYERCKQHDIKPIIGLRVRIEGLQEDHTNDIVLYAKNGTGYKNLLYLASVSALKGIIELYQLKQHRDGIVGVILTKESELIKPIRNNQQPLLQEVLTLFKTHLNTFYFSEIPHTSFTQDYPKLPWIAFDHTLYMNKEDRDVFNTLSSILHRPDDTLLDQETSHHFKSLDEIKELYSKPAIKRTNELAALCDITLESSTLHLPAFPLNNNISAKDYLQALCLKGLDKRLQHTNKKQKTYVLQLKKELDIIDDMGYNDYFLIVWDFVRYAKKSGYLVGPGRGSAAASLVSYCLGITAVDPIAYDLVFERFLNPERITMPDIDIDLPDDKRDDVLQYVRDKYGIDHVASICTFGTFLSKSALRDTARIHNVEGMLLTSILKDVSTYNTIQEAMEKSDSLTRTIEKSDIAKKIVLIAAKLEGLHRHVSTHAAGIIITKDALTHHTPVQTGLLDMMQTQFEAKDLEHLGLLKIDFLGLRNLTSIDQVVSKINSSNKKHLDIYSIPMDDKKTFSLLKRVETTGLFQLESQGMRRLIDQMQVESFEDIVTILALYRPGPMENIPTYIKRRFHEEEIEVLDDTIQEILEPTHGIIIYQEQIIKIVNTYAGYTYGEADVLRRAVSKKQEDVLKQERLRFMKKAKELGRDTKTSKRIYDYIVKFANYGFNRAHSVAYGMISYWMAYLKANYPKEFISVLLSSVIGSEKQTQIYIKEANRLGVKVYSPNVNISTKQYENYRDGLAYPLLGVKYVGINAVNAIVEERKNNNTFTSFIDFVSRMQGAINKRVFESLIYSSALDCFHLTKQTMIKQLDGVINFVQYGSRIDASEFVVEEYEEYSFDQLRDKEEQTIGFHLSMHPLHNLKEYITGHNLLKVSEIEEKNLSKTVRVIGVIERIKVIQTKRDQTMCFMNISDEFDTIDTVLFPRTYDQYNDVLEEGKVIVVQAKVEQRKNTVQLIINKVHLKQV